jgi:hypothetical protein
LSIQLVGQTTVIQSDEASVAALKRAYLDLEIDPLAGGSAESLSIELTRQAMVHAVQARQHIYCLGPILTVVRDRQLYSHHPQRFGTFREWLEQPELSLSESLAYDIINWWKYAAPRLEGLGMTPLDVVENIDVSKLRLLVSPIKRAADQGHPLTDEDLLDLVQAAAGLTWQELSRHVRSRSTHSSPADVPGDNPDFEPEPEVSTPELRFVVTRLPNDRYRIQAELSPTEMIWLQGRVRPLWVDPAGEILQMRADE